MYTYNVVLLRVCVKIAAMEKQQSILFSTVEVRNILYSLYFLSCPSLTQFALQRSIIWRFYAPLGIVNVLISRTVVTYEDLVCRPTSQSKPFL
jgi:hypothetical protein